MEHRSNLSNSDSSINNNNNSNTNNNNNSSSEHQQQNAAAASAASAGTPTKRSSRIDSSIIQANTNSNINSSRSTNLGASSNNVDNNAITNNDESFNIEEEEEEEEGTTDDSEIDYDRKLLRQQYKYQERLAAQQQKDSDLESLKNLLKNLEFLDKTNQLEAFLSPRLNQKQKSASLSNQNKNSSSSKKTSHNMNNLHAKLESFDLVKATSNIMDGEYYEPSQQQHTPHNTTTNSNNTTTATTTTTTASSGYAENANNDPVRVIKITEIIEINNASNPSNLKSLKSHQRTSNVNLSDSHFAASSNQNMNSQFAIEANSDFKFNFNESGHAATKTSSGDVVYHVAKTSENEFRQLPILIEKLAKKNIDTDEQRPGDSSSNASLLRSNLSKNAEIVLEIINILGGASKSRSTSPVLIEAGDLGNMSLVYGGKGGGGGQDAASGGGSGTRPKKITIRITGRTRSVSSDAKKSNASNTNGGNAPVTACVREPIAIEDITGSAKNGKYTFVMDKTSTMSSSHNNSDGRLTSPLNTFKPILDCRVVELDEPATTSAADSSQQQQQPLKKKEEEIKSDLNEIKFNLEKFKSYLTTLSGSANNNFAFAENNNANTASKVSNVNNVNPGQKTSAGAGGNNVTTTSVSSMHTIVNR
jgi:hypothetical protein